MNDELSEDQRRKIKEEENYRQEIRSHQKQKNQPRSSFPWPIVFVAVIMALVIVVDSPTFLGKKKDPITNQSTIQTNVSKEPHNQLEEEKPKQQVETKITVREYLDKEYTLTKKEMDILDTIPSASVFMKKLGSKVLYDEIIGVSKQLIIILAEKESAKIPPGYEKSHEYSIKATEAYLDYARTLADGIYYKNTQKIKDAISKSREATGYLDLSGKLMPKKQ